MANLIEFFPWLKQIGKLIDNGDGSYSPQVAVTGSGAALPVSGTVSVNGATLADPEQTVDGNGGAVGTTAVVVQTAPIATTGSVRVECHLASTQAAAGNGFIRLIHLAADGVSVRRQSAVPTPGSADIVWSRVAVQAGDRFQVANGLAAGGAGTYIWGEIRFYRLA